MKILLETWDDIFSDEVEDALFGSGELNINIHKSEPRERYMIYDVNKKHVIESYYGLYIESIETVEEFKQKYPNGKVFRPENYELTDW